MHRFDKYMKKASQTTANLFGIYNNICVVQVYKSIQNVHFYSFRVRHRKIIQFEIAQQEKNLQTFEKHLKKCEGM